MPKCGRMAVSGGNILVQVAPINWREPIVVMNLEGWRKKPRNIFRATKAEEESLTGNGKRVQEVAKVHANGQDHADPYAPLCIYMT